MDRRIGVLAGCGLSLVLAAAGCRTPKSDLSGSPSVSSDIGRSATSTTNPGATTNPNASTNATTSATTSANSNAPITNGGFSTEPQTAPMSGMNMSANMGGYPGVNNGVGVGGPTSYSPPAGSGFAPQVQMPSGGVQGIGGPGMSGAGNPPINAPGTNPYN